MVIETLTKLCTPVHVYLGISLVLTILASLVKLSFISAAIHLVVIFLWSFFLSYLCEQKLTGLSWFLVIFPLLMLGVFMYGYYQLNNEASWVKPYLVYDSGDSDDDKYDRGENIDKKLISDQYTPMVLGA